MFTSIVDPEFIVSVRKKLNLDQREAAEIFGGGVNAFSRYENGKTKPPLAYTSGSTPSLTNTGTALSLSKGGQARALVSGEDVDTA